MTDLPKRIWIEPGTPHGNWKNFGKWHTNRDLLDREGVAFVLEDTAIPRAEADAMVAAAYEDAANARGMWFGFNSEGEPNGDYCTVREHDPCGMDFYISYAGIKCRPPANARATLDAIARKAVEAERERNIGICVDHEREAWEGYDQWAKGYIAACERIAAAIREEPTS